MPVRGSADPVRHFFYACAVRLFESLCACYSSVTRWPDRLCAPVFERRSAARLVSGNKLAAVAKDRHLRNEKSAIGQWFWQAILQVQSFEHDLEVRTSQGVLFFKPPLLAISVCAYGKKKNGYLFPQMKMRMSMMTTTMIMMMTTIRTRRWRRRVKGMLKKIHHACLQSKPHSLSNGDTGT